MKCLICKKEMEVWREEKYCSNLCTEKAVSNWKFTSKKRKGRNFKDIELKTKEKIRYTLLYMLRTYKNPSRKFTDDTFLEYAKTYEYLRQGKGASYTRLVNNVLGIEVNYEIKNQQLIKYRVNDVPKEYIRNYLGKCRVCGTIIERDNTREMCGSVEHQSGCAWKVITYKKYKKYASIN